MSFTRSFKFQTYCPAASFGDGQPGRQERRLVDRKGAFVSDSSVWGLGNNAWQMLVQSKGMEPTTLQLESLIAKADSESNDIITALAERDIRIAFSDGGVVGIEELLSDDWSTSTKAATLYELQDRISEEDILPWDTIFPALALQSVDDVVISEFLDGRLLASNIIEAMQCIAVTERRRNAQALELRIRSEIQSKAARARHKETDDFKQQVISEWDTGRFTTIAEAARWAQKNFPIKTEVTVRRWIASHKKAGSTT